jgi:hypothetical protein
MKTFELSETVGADQLLHLSIPVSEGRCNYRVVVSLEKQVEAASTLPTKTGHGWPEGYFDRTYGGWIGELERAPQGEYENRESL